MKLSLIAYSLSLATVISAYRPYSDSFSALDQVDDGADDFGSIDFKDEGIDRRLQLKTSKYFNNGFGSSKNSDSTPSKGTPSPQSDDEDEDQISDEVTPSKKGGKSDPALSDDDDDMDDMEDMDMSNMPGMTHSHSNHTVSNSTEPTLNGTTNSTTSVNSTLNATTPSGPSLASIAKLAGLTHFLAAIESANLTETVANLTNVTIFAPADQAITTNITGNFSSEDLASILKSHIVKDVIPSDKLVSGSLETLTGTKLEVVVSNKTDSMLEDVVITVNNVTVTKADIPFEGGVIHIVEKLLVSKPAEKTSGAFNLVSSGFILAVILALF